jgi:hypothetical protein
VTVALGASPGQVELTPHEFDPSDGEFYELSDQMLVVGLDFPDAVLEAIRRGTERGAE